MAARERPTVLLVFAILNIVFGSLALLYNLCCVSTVTGGLLFLGNFTPPPGARPEEVRNIQAVQPFFTELGIACAVILVVGTILGAMLLSSGVGMLGVKPWARWVAVLWAVGSIAFNVAGVGYNIFVLQPRMQKFAVDMQRMNNRPGAQNPFANTSNNPIVDSVSAIVGAVVQSVYCVVLLIVLFLPNVSEAFAGGGAGPRRRRRRREAEEEEPEEEEEERPRRRRRQAEDEDE